MREFFKGWRRKVGCGLLLIAVAFTVVWFRSKFYWDYVDVPFRGVLYSLASDNGALAIARSWNSDGDPIEMPAAWETGEDVGGSPPNGFFEFKDEELRGISVRCQTLLISHLSIALPLSVLSAFFLVLRPRNRQQTRPTQS